MVARWWLLAFLLAWTQHCLLASQHRSYQDAAADMSSGPEDLLLEELVRKWKWAAAQRSNRQRPPQLGNYRFGEEDDEEVEPEEPIRVEPKMNSEHQGHRNFAYRPHDAGFIQRGPAERQMESVNPLIQSAPAIPIRASSVNDIRTAGQKEDIFDDGLMTVEHEQQAPSIPVGKFAESPSSSPEEVDDTAGPVSGDPVAHAIVSPAKTERHHDSLADIYLTALVAGCTASAVAAILALGVCFYRWQRRAKAAQEVEYPAYGITGPGPSPTGKSSLKSSPSSSTPGGGMGWALGKAPKSVASSGDKKLAHSAHMFHFQHQKQQVIALESSHSGCDRRGSNSGGESDEDNEEGDYTVYECPGLAPTGEMEVKNPLFLDDPTPATPAAVKRQSE
nr:EOG090X0B4J [Ceriodaphnia reticulata]